MSATPDVFFKSKYYEKVNSSVHNVYGFHITISTVTMQNLIVMLIQEYKNNHYKLKFSEKEEKDWKKRK